MKSSKRDLYKSVDRFRTKYSFSVSDPIDIPLLIERSKHICVEYANLKTPGLCGLAMVGDIEDTIVLNSNRTKTEQRFDCSHELIHLYLHRCVERSFNCFTAPRSKQNSFLEWQANEGAAEMLVPYRDFIPRFYRHFCEMKQEPFDGVPIQAKLADFYSVSTQVIENRIQSLSYEIHQYSQGVPICEIVLMSRAQQKRQGIQPPDYNDICNSAFIQYEFEKSITGYEPDYA